MFQKISAMSNDMMNKNAWYLNEVYQKSGASMHNFFATLLYCINLPQSLCSVNNELATIAMKPNIYI